MIRIRSLLYLAGALALTAVVIRHGALVTGALGLSWTFWPALPTHRVFVAAGLLCLVASFLPLRSLFQRRGGAVISRRQFTQEPLPTVRRRIEEMGGVAAPDVPLLIDYIIYQAIEAEASDIHLDPTPMGFSVRFRVDGILSDVASIPGHLSNKIANRLKVLSNLVVYEGFLPQDGRLGNDKGKSARGAEFRIAFMPTLHGERIVLRILGRSGGVRALEELGMEEAQLAVLKKHIQKPQGMIILTGPTGSGKTTTIYAALNAIRQSTDRNRAIATLEDPIEFELKGINQSQVDEKKEFTFQRGLRALLRADPDVIMVGEIRDPETARIAIQAGMTGHLIITTVHANSSSATFSRLLEIGVASYSLNASVTAVLSQRLVRRLCITCRRDRPASAAELSQLGLPEDTELTVFEAAGCADCGGSGFKGRHAVFEILEVTEPIRELITQGASADTIYSEAKSQGMKPLFESSLEAIRRGDTSPEEVLRVVVNDD